MYFSVGCTTQNLSLTVVLTISLSSGQVAAAFRILSEAVFVICDIVQRNN